jgi:hypothetical protein
MASLVLETFIHHIFALCRSPATPTISILERERSAGATGDFVGDGNFCATKAERCLFPFYRLDFGICGALSCA